MLLHLLDIAGISPAPTVVMAGPDMAELTDAVADHPLLPKWRFSRSGSVRIDAAESRTRRDEIADDSGTVLIYLVIRRYSRRELYVRSCRLARQ